MTRSPKRIVASSPVAGPAALDPISEADPIRILLIEDNHSYRETLTYVLLKQGFAVQSVGDGASPLGALDAAVDIDVVVLNWRLPKTPGIDLLARLRQQGINIPLVLLTDLAYVADEHLAFDGEANDLKPRGVEVLARRLGGVVETLKRADQPRSDKAMLCGELLLRPDFSRAYWKEVDINLTHGEYNIVHLLASNVGEYVSYRRVYDCLRHEGFVAGRGALGYRANVRSAIKRIRDKFRVLDPTFDKIENYSNFGYCWKKLT
jgi:two-component system, OmpR family, response regulator ChvI